MPMPFLIFVLGIILSAPSKAQDVKPMSNIMDIKDLIRLTTTTEVEKLPEFESVHFKTPYLNPIGYKVNFRLKLGTANGYFYQTSVREILGYQKEGSGEIIAIYLIIERDQTLLKRLNEEIGDYSMAAGHGIGIEDTDIEESFYLWDYEEYTLGLRLHISAFDNYKPYKDYYSITVSKYDFEDYN